MITDCQILGIPETAEIAVIKEAYRKRAKELHPDSTANNINIHNHYLFIEVCNAYQRLIRGSRANKIVDVSKTVTDTNKTSSKSIVKHKDQAYLFYKQGIDLFKKIHPSSWNVSLNSLSPTKSSDKEEQQTKERLKDVIQLFPKAYYYFSIVVNEYPLSVWAEDARNKMGIIEERSQRYRNILESFK